MRRPIHIALAVTVVTTSLLGGAAVAPAMASPGIATPDPTIYAIGYDNDYLYSVDVLTGEGTQYSSPIGMGSAQHLGASFNPNDGILYLTNGDNGQCAIWSVDTVTGVGQEVLPLSFTLPDSSGIMFCTPIVFAPSGELYVGLRSSNGTNYVVKVDFATGDLVQAWEAPQSSIPNFMVYSPQDGLFYLQTSGSDDDMYTFDPTDSTSSAFVNVANGNNQTMYGAAFLPDGTILANSWSDLVSVDLATLGSWSVIGQIAPTDIGVLVNGTQYWPAPDPAPETELPATGVNATVAGATGFGALMVMCLGLMLAVRRRKA